ncbi:MAG: hypothetical protein D6765_15170, partial [Bacteroidetes bacterium]
MTAPLIATLLEVGRVISLPRMGGKNRSMRPSGGEVLSLAPLIAQPMEAVIVQRVATSLQLPERSVRHTLELLAEGATIPFI